MKFKYIIQTVLLLAILSTAYGGEEADKNISTDDSARVGTTADGQVYYLPHDNNTQYNDYLMVERLRNAARIQEEIAINVLANKVGAGGDDQGGDGLRGASGKSVKAPAGTGQQQDEENPALALAQPPESSGYQNGNMDDDTVSACTAILCLAAVGKPMQCTKALNKYFSIKNASKRSSWLGKCKIAK